MTVRGKRLATASIALVSASAIAIAPTVQAPPRAAAPVVHLAAATSQKWVWPPAQQPNLALQSRLAEQPQPPAQQSNALGALFSLDLGRFIIPPSAGQSFPTPPQVPGPSPTPNDFEFEDAIINTYHAIEPWVRYGFEVATYAVGWIPWVGWLAPQIMIFYNFGERIVESLVVNSANWLWGPLPFCEGLGNVAEDSWNALLQLGRDQWNFWLPPLPPLPFDAQEAQTQLAAAETLAPADQSVASPTVKPHPLRDALAALHRFLAGPDAVVPEDVDPQEGVDPQEKEVDLQGKVDLQDKGDLQEMGDLQDKGDLRNEADLHVNEPALVDAQRVSVPASPGDDAQVKADPPQTDATPTASVEPKTDPPAGKPKPFAKKPKPAVETPDSPVRPSKKSAGASNGSGETSNDSVGTPNPSKNRVDRPKKHRSAGSPSGTAANSPDGS